MSVITLTQKDIAHLTCPPGKQRIEICLADFPGLYLEVRATSSTFTWYLRYKNAEGKTQHQRLGNTLSHSLPEAKKAALLAKSELLNGRDAKAGQRKLKEIPTLLEFIEAQYLPYIQGRKRSARDDENRLRFRIIPAFGALRMDALTRKQLVHFHQSLKSEGLAGATCDHYIKSIRQLYNLAIQWEVVSTNPASKIALFNEPNQVENYLTESQLQDLVAVLKKGENRMVCNIAMFLLSTGARLSEGLCARWEQFDLAHRTWKIPALNSKSKKVRSVPLNDVVCELLDSLQPDTALRSGFLFVNSNTGDRVKTVHRAWYKIREEAGVPFLRIHDLRHMYASFMVNAGRSLYEVQQVLGHSSPQITQRYAHLTTDTLQAAAQSASALIRAATQTPARPALRLLKTGS